jgi:predicted Rossmann-fold nucleotide-binding protein
VSLVWNKLQTGVLEKRPLVLVGDCWKPVVEAWQKHLAVSESDVRYLDFADDAGAAADIIISKAKAVKI